VSLMRSNHGKIVKNLKIIRNKEKRTKKENNNQTISWKWNNKK
jgi:hypothetical protein